jgi:cAMP-dependent protein kinase regulator
VVESG